MISNMLRFPLANFPFHAFDALEQGMNAHFPYDVAQRLARTEANYPPVNMGTTNNSVELSFFIAGLDTDSLDIVLEKNVLSVSGERKLPDVANDEQNKGTYYRQERFGGRFKRVITLPEDVDTEHAEAGYQEGILQISIAKRAEAQPRQISVAVQ